MSNYIGITNTMVRKIVKYTDFINIMKREWRFTEFEFIPVVMGITGLHRKNFSREIDKIWGNVNINQLQIKMICPLLINNAECTMTKWRELHIFCQVFKHG